MSDEEQSADNKNFLARWSQRKHEAKQPDHDAPTANSDVPSGPVAESDVAQEFDLSSLPKLEDMTATTDITAFLRKGVPEHLRNAALRKSWALDPAIRNYVNPALDYAYDWNTPGGVPGSSEIGSGMDVARLVSQIMGSGESAVGPPAPAVAPGNETAGDPAQSLERGTTDKSGLELPVQAVRLSQETVSMVQKPANAEEGSHIVAEGAEHSEVSRSAAPQQVVRRHGSAKPLV
ncbi:MAG TPA: DUF3306 domain-containing protein [Bradyrhizobium sp.]|nr:DUF3306 domain-containing protein [Bradyrhizobium sp.]